jgi:hypothetical protein
MIVKITFNSSNPFISVTQGSPIYVRILQGSVSGGGGSSDWNDITNKPSTFTPSAHSHVISDVTGLQTALNGKAASSHSHVISDVTGLQTALDGKQASGSYAAASHSHIIADVTGLQTALDGKAATSHTHTRSQITDFAHTHIIGDITGLQTALDGKQASGSYAAASHTHVIADTTGLQTALDVKQKTITSGTAAPSGGADGDIYLQYT